MTASTRPGNGTRDAGAVAVTALVALLAGVVVFARLDVGPAGPAPSEPPDTAYRVYQDPSLGLHMRLPAAMERSAQAAGPPAEAAGRNAPDRQVTFVSTDGEALLDVSVWEPDPGRAPLPLWVGVTAGHLLPVDGAALPNGSIAGAPAAVLWRPPTADAPAEYAAFLEHEGRYVRIRYVAADNGAFLDDFRGALASLAWPSGDSAALIPPLPPPNS